MNDYLTLQEFVASNRLDAEILEMPANTRTAKMASEALGIPLDRIVKSVVFVTKSGSGVVAIVSGTRRVSFEKLERVVGETVNTASPEEVLRLTGYEAGAVPPIGTGLRTVMDADVMKMDQCYAGGGSEQHLIRISPHAIRKSAGAETADIAK